jgi:hypothetical protein
MTADALLRRTIYQNATAVLDRTRDPRTPGLVAIGARPRGLSDRERNHVVLWIWTCRLAGAREPTHVGRIGRAATQRQRRLRRVSRRDAAPPQAEQREFADFLAHLRDAKDKAEFDAFMAERRARPQPERSA